ncbi:MAG: hypothetical protein ACR2Q3_14205 [Woeseiaceae bacterium]
MFDHAQGVSATGVSNAADDIDALIDEVAQLGFDPPQRSRHDSSIMCGTSFRVSVSRVLAEQHKADALLVTLRRLNAKRVPVCLVPEDFPTGTAVIEAWSRFCELIQSGISGQGRCGPELGFCMHSHRMPLGAFCLVTDSLLGSGPRYVFLDSLQMAEHGDSRVAERTASNWRFLWRHRHHPRPVQPVYGGLVRSGCRLLADEVAAAVIPTQSLLAPVGSAWLPIGMPITRFCKKPGTPDWHRLRAALRRLVDLTDTLFPRLDWHDPRQCADAMANRRVAVCVTGLGDLLLQSGRLPGALESLNWLTKIVRCIQQVLSAQSSRRAATSGLLPALAQANPVLGWADGKQRERWQQQWEIAVSEAAVRHRNLLVMSPSSVLPAHQQNCAAFTDLLPVLRFADAWSFDCSVQTPGFKLTQFRDFHRRARATIQSAQRSSFVAAGV